MWLNRGGGVYDCYGRRADRKERRNHSIFQKRGFNSLVEINDVFGDVLINEWQFNMFYTINRENTSEN